MSQETEGSTQSGIAHESPEARAHGDGQAVAAEAVHDGPDPRFEPMARHPDRVERLIGLAFLLALGCVVGLGITYWFSDQVQLEAGLLGGALGLMGIGVVAWAKYLLPNGPFVEQREPLASSRAEREAWNVSFNRGLVPLKRRSMLGLIGGAVVGALTLFLTFPLLRSLGPNPGKALDYTAWTTDSLVVDDTGRPMTVDTLEVGGWETVFPSDDVGGALSQTLLIRVSSEPLPPLQPGREGWTPAGYVAFSKVCTHAGCPVALYQEQTQQLLCPCHQSLFNILSGAKPVFGPAPRPLPQLPLKIDDVGYLRAQSGYDEPIGPGFWERG